MSKLGLPLAATLILGAAHTASAGELSGTPYTFTGTVVSATAACPYKAKTALAGYTLVAKRYEYLPPNYQQTLAGFSGPQLIFSPAAATLDPSLKSTMKIGDLPLRSGTVSGSEQILFLPSIDKIKGTYKGTFSLRTGNAFVLNYTSTFPYKGASCTTTYDLSFAVGIPSKFLNLL